MPYWEGNKIHAIKEDIRELAERITALEDEKAKLEEEIRKIRVSLYPWMRPREDK